MNNNALDAIIFDLDGVIVFTDQYHCKSWDILAAKLGWDFGRQLNNRLLGLSRMDSLEIILEHNGIEAGESEKRKYARMKNDLFLDMLNKELSRKDMYPGALDFLNALQKRSMKLALCSSSRNARAVINKLGIQDYFYAVVSGKDIERGKPDPQIFLQGARLIQAEPARCLVFEDAEAGVKAARSAGMRVIGIGNRNSLPSAEFHIDNYNNINIDSLLQTGQP